MYWNIKNLILKFVSCLSYYLSFIVQFGNLITSRKKPFENKVVKGENAGN